VLAPAAGVAGRRSVGPAVSGRARPAGPARTAGLVPCRAGQRQRPRQKGGELTGPNPTDRGKNGTKYHLLVTADGLPLAVAISGANRHDSVLVEPILDRLPPVKGVGRGRPRRRPVKLHADKGYDNNRVRRYLRQRGIIARIARRGVDSGDKLGRYRWVVERTMSWLLGFRRLALRYDRSAKTITALATLACTVICHRRL
jgi:transposase